MKDNRQKELALIHIAKKDLRMDDDTYRAMLWTHGRVKSSSDLDAHGRGKVIQHLRNIGWVQIKNRKKYSPASRNKPQADKTQVDKMRAMWISMHKDGMIRDGSEAALTAFVRRMTGIESVEWLIDGKQANKVIEALKKMRERLEKKQ